MKALMQPATAKMADSTTREIAARRDRHALGGVQIAGNGFERTAAEESQSAQDGETKAENDFLWRIAA